VNRHPFVVTLQSDRDHAIRFPVPPEAIEVEVGANTLVYGSVTRGEILIPRGRKAKRIRFDGVFLGPARRSQLPGLTALWVDPNALCAAIEGWVGSDATGQPQELYFSLADVDAGLHVAQDVYVESFSWRYAGGDGDVAYRLALSEARPLRPGTASTKSALRRSGFAQPSARATADGDTLFRVAARAYGDPDRWLDLRAANPDLRALAGGVPGADDTLPPGVLLVVPA
jgi:hypothetical protein